MLKIKKATYKGKVYNIEAIFVYDEYISLYEGDLENPEVRPFNVDLQDVEFVD